MRSTLAVAALASTVLLLAPPLGLSGAFLSDPAASTDNVFEAEVPVVVLDGDVADRRVTGQTCRVDLGASRVVQGNLDGDGTDDLVFAAPRGNLSGRGSTGELHVLLGPVVPDDTSEGDLSGSTEQCSSDSTVPAPGVRDLAVTPANVSILGRDDGDLLGGQGHGTGLAVGDLDADGLDDIVVAAPRADGPDGDRAEAGEVYVVFGRSTWPSGLDLNATDPDVEVIGATSGDRLGSVVGVADVTGDGVADLVTGAPGADGSLDARTDAGEVHVFHGPLSSGRIDLADSSADLRVIGPDGGDLLARSGAVLDLDGDGVHDLLPSAPGGDGPNGTRTDAGEIHILLGGSLGTGTRDLADSPADRTVFGEGPGDELGEGLGVGDVGGDGLRDLVVTAPLADGPDDARIDAGSVYVLHNGSGFGPVVDLSDGVANQTIHGNASGDRLGTSLVVGPLNTGSRDDIVVGSTSGNGTAYVLLSRIEPDPVIDLASQPAWRTIVGNGTGDRLGAALAFADHDGDGRRELAVGAPGADAFTDRRTSAGEVLIYEYATLED